MSDPVFDVTYRVGIGNLNAFFDAWQRRTWFDRANIRRYLLYSFGILVLLLFGLRSVVSAPHFWPSGLGFDVAFAAFGFLFLAFASGFLGFVLVFIIAPLITYVAQLLVFASGPMRKRTSRLRVDSTGISKAAGEADNRIQWRDCIAVVETKKTVLLFTSRNSATIVPKSAFASPAEAEAFAAFAKAQWKDAHSIF